jgi:hypothetical protein
MLLGRLVGVCGSLLTGPTVPALAVTVVAGDTVVPAAEVVLAAEGGTDVRCRLIELWADGDPSGRDAQAGSNSSAATSTPKMLRRVDTVRLVVDRAVFT